jgi:hypothetical protein
MNFHDANGDSGLSPACTAPKPARKLLSESVAVPRQRRVKAAGWQAPSSTFTLYPGAHDLRVRSHTAASPDDVVSPRVVRTYALSRHVSLPLQSGRKRRRSGRPTRPSRDRSTPTPGSTCRSPSSRSVPAGGRSEKDGSLWERVASLCEALEPSMADLSVAPSGPRLSQQELSQRPPVRSRPGAIGGRSAGALMCRQKAHCAYVSPDNRHLTSTTLLISTSPK